MSLSQDVEKSSDHNETQNSTKNAKLDDGNMAPVEKSTPAQNSSMNAGSSSSSQVSATKKRRLESSESTEAKSSSSAPKKNPDYIAITIIAGDEKFTAKIRPSTKISNLRMFIADKIDKDPLSLTLLCNERRCNDKDTVGGLCMEDGDVISCVQIQSGG